MLYYLHGEDRITIKNKIHKLTDVLLGKRPGARVLRYDEETFPAPALEELVGVSGLFESKHIIILDNVLEDAEAKDAIMDMVKEIAESENMFLVASYTHDESVLSVMKEHGATIEEFAQKKEASTKKNFQNIFVLSDALGVRDKKKAWTLYREFLDNGSAAEEIHGTVFWQFKSIMLASEAGASTESTNMKPFAFSKQARFAKNFTQDELRTHTKKLAGMIADARQGGESLEVALEKFILSL